MSTILYNRNNIVIVIQFHEMVNDRMESAEKKHTQQDARNIIQG